MSKMSQLHAELSEQATELGFESLEEALANGYEVDYEEGELVNPYVLSDKAHEEAHEEWVKERDNYLEILDVVKDVLTDINNGLIMSGDVELIQAWQLEVLASELERAIEFFKKGEV